MSFTVTVIYDDANHPSVELLAVSVLHEYARAFTQACHSLFHSYSLSTGECVPFFQTAIAVLDPVLASASIIGRSGVLDSGFSISPCFTDNSFHIARK